MRKKNTAKIILGFILMALVFSACGSTKKNTSENKTAEVKLDPENPVYIKVWHYYNGIQQAAFDELVKEFNATKGKEVGINVQGFSQGSVAELAAAVSDSIDGKVGADKLPDIFSSYADTAYYAQQKGKIADLTKYFSKSELDKYVDSYIEEGYLEQNDALYLFPVAKSTEVMMINKTDWEPFAKQTGSSLDELKTIEGVAKVAERYYKWTDEKTPKKKNDGKAFYGRDSMSNYFVIGMKQLGSEIFEVNNGKVKFNTDRKLIKRLWKNYYVPFIKGYFTALGKFRSDDVKTGDILAYTGSSMSAMYFPDNVENDNGEHKIDYEVLSAPIMSGGENYKVQQGADMAVTKSDEKHEYASCVFLKWFTQKENNIQFACESSYMPVLKEANNVDALDKIIDKRSLNINGKTYDCMKNVLEDFGNTKYYTTKNFENGSSARNVLDTCLSDRVKKDKSSIDKAVSKGEKRDSVIKRYTSEKSFESWYKYFCAQLKKSIQ